jgi:phage gpG-like protein
MPDEGVKVVGFDELKRGSADLFDQIGKRARKDLEHVASRRAEMVRGVVPRVTGRLAASVTAEPYSGGALAGIGDTSTPYAGWVEFGGTRGRPYVPQGRYLYPIALEAGQLVDRDMTAATKDEIRGHRWPKPQTTA